MVWGGLFGTGMSIASRAGGAAKRLARDGAMEVAHQASGISTFGFRDHVKREVDEHTTDRDATTWRAKAGQSVDIVGVFLTITVAAVIGYIGLTVMSETESTAEFTDNSEFDNASEDLTSGVGTSMGLSEVLFIVLILGAIIGVLVGLRRR